MYRDYAPKDVQFHFIYKSLAHPENNGYVNPITVEERLLHIREAKRVFEGTTIPWLADNMQNDLKVKLGGLNNPEFIFDPEGKIVRLRDWSSPDQLREDLEKLVGPVEKTTSVRDLGLKLKDLAAPTAKKGVVPRIQVPSATQPIKVIANTEDSKSPFYAKLRAEADAGLLGKGAGKLYVGFHLDPLLNVCWNNLAKPVEYTITSAGSAKIAQATGTGPKVEVESDSDPREFLVDITDWKEDEQLTLEVRYFACNKDEGWCKPVTQTYELQLEEDKNAGMVRARSGGGRGRGGRGGAGGRGGGPGGRGRGGAGGRGGRGGPGGGGGPGGRGGGPGRGGPGGQGGRPR